MNYRGYLPAEERAMLERRDAHESAVSWLGHMESRYARKGQTKRQKAFNLEQLEIARKELFYWLVN